jgi:hydroxymethylbilane synthase
VIVRLGTRGSDLALRQAHHVRRLLEHDWPGVRVAVRVIATRGDRILETPLPLVGGKGIFTAELESALRDGSIDAAVHSLKDLPVEQPEGLVLGALPRRADPADALVSRDGCTLGRLAAGARVGTSSPRRTAQLLYARPDLQIVDIRGNVDTRVRKTFDCGGPYDAVVLARAGLERMGLGRVVTEVLPRNVMLPSPGQGAIAVQCRDTPGSRRLFLPIDDRETRLAVTAERAFLAALGGGCALPISALAEVSGGCLCLYGRVSAGDGSRQVDVRGSVRQPALATALELGASLARSAAGRGAAELLRAAA